MTWRDSPLTFFAGALWLLATMPVRLLSRLWRRP